MMIDIEQSSADHANIPISTKTRVNDKGNSRANARRRIIKNNVNKLPIQDGANVNTSSNLELRNDLEFESKEDAFSFYKEYAKSTGFSIIIKASRRSRISGKFIDAKFVCTRYGKKGVSGTDETQESTKVHGKKKRGRINKSWSKTDCKAFMHVKRNQDDGKWIIRSFIKEHNHEISPEKLNYFQGHNRDINVGNVNDSTSLRFKKTYASMSRKPDENDNKIANKRGVLVLEEGDTQYMLDNFMCMQAENPHFFYALDLNEEHRFRNVFWVDAKSKLDYTNFSDVVFFDTTYVKNEYQLPLALFIGVNHHFQILFLGYGLIGEKSKSTYIWIMRSWLRAMGGRAPMVILTNQDNALKEAIAEVFPDSRHCFCLRHILRKVPKNLGHVTGKHNNFTYKFNKCVFMSWDVEQFEKKWLKMVDRFDLKGHVWVEALYEDRHRWVPAYIKDVFFAGLSTSERSENISCFLDKYVQKKTSLKQFLNQYKILLKEKCEEEAKADFEMWHKQPRLKSPSPFGKQMSTIYTHSIFKKFQVEFMGVVACHPKKVNENGSSITYKVCDFEKNQDFMVFWNKVTYENSCSCFSFEYNGYLCRHVLIILQICGLHNIPSCYIMKRWTKDAKISKTTHGLESDVVESKVQRYTDLCKRALKLGDEVSISEESFNIAFNALEEALRKCESVNNSISSVVHPTSPLAHDFHEIEEINHGNSTKKPSIKNVSNKRKVRTEPDFITIGLHNSWQKMEQLNSRVESFDGYFGAQQIMQGTGEEVNLMAPSCYDYYGNQQSMQGLDN